MPRRSLPRNGEWEGAGQLSRRVAHDPVSPTSDQTAFAGHGRCYFLLLKRIAAPLWDKSHWSYVGMEFWERHSNTAQPPCRVFTSQMSSESPGPSADSHPTTLSPRSGRGFTGTHLSKPVPSSSLPCGDLTGACPHPQLTREADVSCQMTRPHGLGGVAPAP